MFVHGTKHLLVRLNRVESYIIIRSSIRKDLGQAAIEELPDQGLICLQKSYDQPM